MSSRLPRCLEPRLPGVEVEEEEEEEEEDREDGGGGA
jgi:hypothetical protein